MRLGEGLRRFEPTSAEQLRGRIETRVHDALVAVRVGTPLVGPAHAEALRDLVVLHYVRSYRSQKVSCGVFERAPADLVVRLASWLPQQKILEVFRETSLRLTEPGGLVAYAERYGMDWDHEREKTFLSIIMLSMMDILPGQNP